MTKNAYVLKPTYGVYHSFLHAQISDESYQYRLLPIRHFQHFGVMVKKYEDEIDFKYLENLAQNYNIADIWHAYLYLQNDFFDLLKTKRKDLHL